MTSDDLASALGVALRTFERYRKRGMPQLADGQAVDEWVEVAQQWRDANRKKPGPRAVRVSSDAAGGDALERQRELRNKLLELQLAERKGELHSTKECEAMAVRRLGELRNAFAMLPDQLARALYQAPTPDAIKLRDEEHLRRIFEVLSRE